LSCSNGRFGLFRIIRALWREFGEVISPHAVTEPAVASVQPTSTLALSQVREIGFALMQMAEEQIALQGQVETISARTEEAYLRLDKAAEVVKGFHRRLTTIEHRMMPYEAISPEQATEVRLAVQRQGELLTGQAARSRKPGEKLTNYYSSIFTEIYNRTGAPRYELIRIEDYADVMRFLEEWHHSAATQSEGPQQ
jgi:hypothetical protein